MDLEILFMKEMGNRLVLLLLSYSACPSLGRLFYGVLDSAHSHLTEYVSAHGDTREGLMVSVCCLAYTWLS